MDIVEIALSGLTDFTDVEKLACEVMRNECYPDIKPLGGMHDQGQDALVERFYENEGRRSRTIFQITTQETIEAKLKTTIERLDGFSVEYSRLVLVASRAISSERQERLRSIALASDVQLEIVDRKTLVNRLADFDNGIFHRHFPDIERQVQTLVGKGKVTQLDKDTLLRTAFIFTTADHADRAKLTILRELLFAPISQCSDREVSPDELVEMHRRVLPQSNGLDRDQVASALDRWVSDGFSSARGSAW